MLLRHWRADKDGWFLSELIRVEGRHQSCCRLELTLPALIRAHTSCSVTIIPALASPHKSFRVFEFENFRPAECGSERLCVGGAATP